MKLVRYDAGAGPRIGAVKGDGIVDLAAAGARWMTMREVIAAGPEALDAIAAIVARSDVSVGLDGARLLAPIERPGKYLAIGMNYAKHRDEADKLGIARTQHQLWFNKQTSCLSGPFDAIEPGVTEKLDYEVELGVVIGKAAKRVSETEAPGHVFGYVVANDVSARDWQMHSPTFTMGKSFDTHGPIGPWIVTADEIADPHALGLRCFVNGEKRQDSNTGEMVANLWAQIAYLSTAFTLEPGDLIATGTPHGVGAALEPPIFLQPGDVVRCEIDGIGAIENVVAARP
ncbi:MULTISPECIES: fumarylacetoacetate hydrolase family protein [unclassified Sphingomonas]|uniref:fumarylacetoacetate hydrolase family protein n=1 Tax=unclassified Sphingomonas TaxID=196159 RepID=UPI000701B9CF|nr:MULTISPECIES: fumarylacetoacetate hydrolase family protein [unclassified Sphingomonas]KQX19644.1 5-carboxymethyl-2-hydroxymuconate isomerase [Sphingomonas sp. Root1294]KQY65845.1 5-carboxymethyl-2-hydroxymuconate isomerase [Sphingomonas sp. Root50]KRB94848.1 5-carboxymethyl-2-hydroxymuconate isomerase [Sphingomonas sp. Root720]